MILQDHKKVKNKFITPLNDTIKNQKPISYEKEVLPEIIWIGLLINKVGLEKTKVVINLLFELLKNEKNSCFPFFSSFKLLNDKDKSNIYKLLDKEYLLNDVQIALAPLIILYPNSNLEFLKIENYNYEEKILIDEIRNCINMYFQKFSQPAIILIAMILSSLLVNGKLIVSDAVEPFNLQILIDDYNSITAQYEGRRVKSIINMVFGLHMEKNIEWGQYFWAKSYKLANCKQAFYG